MYREHRSPSRTDLVVGSFADSTGKINAVAAGSTGAFVPQGGSAAYITDPIRKAGGQAVSTFWAARATGRSALCHQRHIQQSRLW